MDFSVLWKGALLGFSIAAPVGAIGVLCIRRSLGAGFAAGFVSGLGAATADALYGSVAGLGLTAVAGGLLAARGWLRLAGGVLLLALGARTFFASPAAPAGEAHPSGADGEARSPAADGETRLPAADREMRLTAVEGEAPRPAAAAAPARGLLRDYASTLALTLTNPATIVSFTAAFGALGLATGLAAGSLVAGVFLGSAAWWLVLAGATSLLRGRFSPTGLVWVNRFSGLLVGGFGLVALAAAWRS